MNVYINPLSNRHLDFAKRLCRPPAAKDSVLASNLDKLAKQLFCDCEDNAPPPIDDIFPPTDMEIVVHEGTDDDDGGAVVIGCHRVVLAARCEYFRLALLSGMREERERRIHCYDSSPAAFRAFLRFVYGGRLEMQEEAASVDNMAELLMLADRYILLLDWHSVSAAMFARL